MVQFAKNRMRNNVSEPFDRARGGSVLPELWRHGHYVVSKPYLNFFGVGRKSESGWGAKKSKVFGRGRESTPRPAGNRIRSNAGSKKSKVLLRDANGRSVAEPNRWLDCE
jgi:hypothetical protein